MSNNSKNTHRPSEQVRLDISRLNPDARLTYGRHMAAQKRHAVLVEICIGQLTVPRGGETLDTPANLGGLSMAWIQSDHGRELASAAQVITILESSEAYAEAQDKLVPLLSELDASEAAEAEHAAKVSAARNKLEEAKADAVKKAMAKVEKDFATA